MYEVVLDLRGTVVAVGPRVAALAGSTPEELVGRPVVRLLRGPALTGPPGQTMPIEIRADGRPPVAGLGLRAVEGERVSITFLPEPDSSAPRPTTRESRRASEGVDPRLVTDVVRELHDPLTGITGFSTLAQLAATPHRRKYYLDQVTSQAERVRRLAQSLDRAFLARPPSGSVVDLASDIGRVVSATRLALERHGIAFDLDAPHSVWANCDARQIGDMVVAIVHRATLAQRRDYQANEVAVQVRAQSGHARIEIALGGADQPALLLRERFGLGDDGPGLVTPGELELDAAQRALELQGGTCTIAADKETEEVHIVLSLPSSPAPPRPDPLRTPVPLELLAVDDDAMIGELYSELLAASGHTVTPCRSLYAAREALRQQRFDAVVSEFQLKDGLLSELVVQSAENHPELGKRLLVVTRDPRDPRLREWAAREGTPIVAKPFQPSLLLERIAALTQ
ncbi:MAG: hypothetical protein U1F43_20350 [Myxococcota bacterium]